MNIMNLFDTIKQIEKKSGRKIEVEYHTDHVREDGTATEWYNLTIRESENGGSALYTRDFSCLAMLHFYLSGIRCGVDVTHGVEL